MYLRLLILLFNMLFYALCCIFGGFLWYGVVSAPSPWVTSEYAPCRKVEALERTVFPERLEPVL